MLDSTLTSIASYLKMHERFKTLIMEEISNMSKKTPEHKRLFKLWKAGFFNKVPITDAQRTTLINHYPAIFSEVIS
jgi:hypothetical protein